MLFSRANFGTFSTSLAIQACGAVTGILTARLLGPAARGELATVILWPTILSNLGLVGCSWALARRVAADPAHESEWIAAGVFVGLVSAVFFSLGGFFLLRVLIPGERTYLLPLARLCLWLLPLDICNQILLAAEQGRMRWGRYNWLRLSFFVLYLSSIGMIGWTRRAGVLWFVAAFLTSQLLAVLLRLWVHRKSFMGGRLRFGRCRELLHEGIPYFGATASNLIALQFDTILVVSLLNTEAAGIYAVASAVANGQFAIGDALGITSFGALSNEPDRGRQGKMIGEIFRQSALLSSAAGLALASALPFIIVPLFGRSFAASLRPAIGLALAASLLACANILNQGLRGAGRPHAGLASQLLGTGAMAAAALVLLRRFGLMGMALAVGISACVQIIVLVGAAAKWLRISPVEFWPFRAGNLKLFLRQLAALRLRSLRTAA